MPNRPLDNLIPYLFSIVIPLALGLYLRIAGRRHVASSFALVLFLFAFWSTVSLIELVSASPAAKLFWDDMQFLAGGAVGVAILSFSFRYEGTWFKRSRTAYRLLSSIPVLIWLFLVTDPLHHLAMVPQAVAPGAAWGGYAYHYTLPTFALAGVIIAIALAGIGRIGMSAAKELRGGRFGGLCVFLGLLLALFGAIVSIYGPAIFGKALPAPLARSMIWLGAGDILIAAGVLRFGLFGFLPVARKVLFEGLSSPVFVIDDDGFLMDSNRAFSELTGLDRRAAKGKKVLDLLSGWPEAARKALASADGWAKAEIEAVLPLGGEDRTFHVEVRPVLEESREESRGSIVVMRDITRIKETEKELLAMNLGLERRVAERTGELEKEVARRAAAEGMLRKLNAEIASTQREILLTLSEVVETRSRETAYHVYRVGEYTRILARAIGLSPENVALMADASPLHDIGKIGIPERILNKESSLSKAERLLMRNHSAIGYEILNKSEHSLIRTAAIIALDHHENWDGTGYPSGKKGEGISLSGRIVRVCDVFDALLSSRPYKSAWSMPATLEYFGAERGRLFDPALVDVLLVNAESFLEVAERYPDEQSETPMPAEIPEL